MNTEKKLYLFVASFALLLVLLNLAPAVMSIPGAGSSLTPATVADFSLSNEIEAIETTIDLDGITGMSGWYISDVNVTFSVLTSAPEFSTFYSYDGDSWILYDGLFTISTEGYTTIQYYSLDSFGSIESAKTELVQIDKTAPSLILETKSVPGVGLNITLTAIETVSYVVDVRYSLDQDRWQRYYGPFVLKDEGIHTIEYLAQDAAGHLTSKFDTFEVVIEPIKSPTEITYIGDTSGVYSDPITLEALLVDVLTGQPLADKAITFVIGSQTTIAITDSAGYASSSLILDQPAAVYTLSVVFDGDDEYLASSTTTEFVIAKETAISIYSGLTIIDESDNSLTLMATVLDDDDGTWGDLTRIYVTFIIYLSSDSANPLLVTDPIMVIPTSTDGVGIATTDVPNLPEGEYLIIASLSDEFNLYYESPDSEAATITIYESTRGKVTGAGWIKDSDGNKGHFVFLVKYGCRGTLWGFAHYTLRVDNLVYFVRTNEITGFSIDGNHAFFEATCTIFVLNLDTWEKTQLEDDYRLRIDVWDYKKRCGHDIFQIQIFDNNGLLVYQAGFDPIGYLHRGNISIHDLRWKHRSRHCHKMWHW